MPHQVVLQGELKSGFSLFIKQFFANIKVWFELLKFRHYTQWMQLQVTRNAPRQ
jgi:alpha-D-ribose 1-methylphosphonate 5-triphosphate synthase subunit PhnL